MTPEPVLLTTSEVAELFRVDQSTVRRWIEEGRMAAVTLPGGRKRYRRTDIEAILAGNPSGSAA